MRMETLLKEMSQKTRDALPSSAFVFPDRKAWPIHDKEHAEIALRYIQMGRAKKSEIPTIKRAIVKRYPDLKKEAESARPPVEEAKKKPEMLKRCVYAVASEDPSRKELNKAFAVCTAMYQKKGYMTKGDGMKLTKAGKTHARRKARDRADSGFSVGRYEKLLAVARGE